jgi:hypothetical protein
MGVVWIEASMRKALQEEFLEALITKVPHKKNLL